MKAKKLTSSLIAFFLVFAAAFVVAGNAKAASLLNKQADLSDLFVLDKLFKGSDSRIFDQSGSNLGNLFILDKLFNDTVATQPVPAAAPVAVVSVADRVAGKIVLQVQNNGEAWYVNPATKKRTFLNGPNSAYQAMAKMSLGISNADFNAINTGNAANVPARVSGRFLLKTEDSGKLYYVNPTNKQIYQISNPGDAGKVMAQTGLGISNADLNQIAVAN